MATFIACFAFVDYILPQWYESAYNERLDELVDELGKQIEESPLTRIEDLVRSFAFKNHAQITLETQFHGGNEEVIISMQDNLGAEVFFNYLPQGEELVLLRREVELTNQIGNTSHSLIIEASLQPITHIMVTLREMIRYLLMFVLVISSVVAFIISYSLARPIVKISQMSRKMKRLDLTERLHVKRRDEIGELASNLNDMANQLDYSMKNLSETNDKLQEEMMKEKKRQQQQKEFFMAASHELKTPLTILKTQLNGMIEDVGIYQDRDLYLNRASEITENMSELVVNMLHISQLNSNEMILDTQTYNMGQLVEETAQSYEALADKKRISLTYFCEEDINTEVNKMQFQAALSNIIANAILYSPKGELVNIQLQREGELGLLTVENYGATLTDEAIRQLFDPFYRVEKSRSRHTGGSGLGLYIVKNILEMHGFDYHLKNSKKGVIFTIIFPFK